jgi:hypothetical protein
MKSSHAVLLGCLAILVGSCAPALITQKDRFVYVQSYLVENAKHYLQCQNVSFEFVETQTVPASGGGKWGTYDYYIATGCSKKLHFVTRVAQVVSGTAHATKREVSPVPSNDEFLEQAVASIRSATAFQLDCEDLAFTPLNAVATFDRKNFNVTLGVSGCGKKTSYSVECVQSTFIPEKQRHQIACKNGSGGGQVVSPSASDTEK